MSAQHLSIVLSGGISLGAYHAGVMAQLGWFLEAWQDDKSTDEALPDIFVDVVSGASAGALTGAMLFQYVATGYYKTKPHGQDSTGRFEFLQANYNAWCRDLSFHKLLDRASKDKDRSLLSNKLVEELATSSIGDYEVSLPNRQERLFLTCTVTSLKPLNFEIELPNAVKPERDTGIVGTTRRDWVTYQITTPNKVPERMRDASGAFSNLAHSNSNAVFMELASTPNLGPQADNRGDLWNRLRFFALASGAFPLAWSPVQISRNLRFYPEATRGDVGQLDECVFEYMDGGVIDNMPLDRATKVIHDYALWTDASAGITSRTYVLIDVSPAHNPQPVTLNTGRFDPRHDTQKDMVQELGPMLEAVREQGYYRDLLQAAKVNLQLAQREDLIWPFLKRHALSLNPVEQLQQEITKAQKDLVAILTSHYHTQSEDEVAHLTRMLRDQYLGRYHQFFEDIDGLRKELFLLTMIVSDFVSELSGKHHLLALRIQPTKTLKSAFFGDFGGFVQQSFMRDDFWHGMQCARKALSNWLAELAPGKSVEHLFCTFSDFQRATGDASLVAQDLEGYYRDDSSRPTEWADAELEAQNLFLITLSSRINEITGRLSGLLVKWGAFFSSGKALALCCLLAVASLGGLFVPAPYGSVMSLVFGLFTGLTIPLIYVCRLIVPKVSGLIPKVKKRPHKL